MLYNFPFYILLCFFRFYIIYVMCFIMRMLKNIAVDFIDLWNFRLIKSRVHFTNGDWEDYAIIESKNAWLYPYKL